MRHRRTVLYSALALAVFTTGGAYLALQEPPHQASFEPPGKVEEWGRYGLMSRDELLKLKDAGDWQAFVQITDLSEGDFDEAFVKARADAGYEAARVMLANQYLELEERRPPLSDVFKNLDRSDAAKAARKLLNALRERMRPGRAEGIALLETAADGGYPDAQSLLGQRLLLGRQVTKDVPRAIFWLERAARGGETTSASLLTRLYYQGRITPRDDAKCLFFARLTRNPYIPAALLLLNERGDRAKLPAILRDLATTGADYLYETNPLVAAQIELRGRPAELGSEWAAYRLGLLKHWELTSFYDRSFNARGVTWFESDLPEDIQTPHSGDILNGYEKQAHMPGVCLTHAQAGDSLAQYVLGCSRLTQAASAAESDADDPWQESPGGRLRAKSPASPEEQAEGVAWLRKSSAQGLHAAMGKLGECLLRGTGVKADKVEAAYWLSLATTDIHTRYERLRDRALASLAPDERAAVAARVLDSRRATLARVRPELEARARAGDNEARFALARLITRITPDRRPDAEALALLETAAENNHRHSQRLLGLHHLTSPGGDVPHALTLLDRAARAGDVKSAAILARVYYQGKTVPRDDARCLEYTRLTRADPLLVALALNGRCEKAPEVLRALQEIKDRGWYDDVMAGRIRLRFNTELRFWDTHDTLDNLLRTDDYDAVCAGNTITWFDHAPGEFLDAPVWGRETPPPAPETRGACMRDAQAGDKLAQYVLGCDRIAASFELAEDDPAVKTLLAEALEWLKRSAEQGFRPAVQKLACYHDPIRGLKPDKVEYAYREALDNLLKSGVLTLINAPTDLTPEERAAVTKRLEDFRRTHAAAMPATK